MAKEMAAQMKCPHCGNIWGLTQRQLDNNQFFTCPRCHKRNQGSHKADENGVLIGMKTVYD